MKVNEGYGKLLSLSVLLSGAFQGFPGLSFAARTEIGQQTVWDRIMAEQAARDLQEGGRLLEEKSYPQAVREFARAVAARPDDPWTHMMLGAAYYWSGQVDLAMKEYDESLRLDGRNAQAHQLLGIAYAWKGDSEGALKEFLEADRLSPDKSDIQMDLGSVYESLNEVPQALDRLRRAVRLDDSHPLYHFQLGLLYSRLGRDSDALEAFDAALKRFPDYEDALLEIGAVWERLENLDKAIAYFRKALHLKPKDGVARFRLAHAYLRRSEPANVSGVLGEAFWLSPEGREGLGLSVAYNGKRAGPESPPPGADRPQAGKLGPSDPLESFRRNLERIPLDQQARVEVDLAYTPRPELTPIQPGEGKMQKALEASEKLVSPAIGVRRQFILPAGDPEKRKAQIEAVLKELDSAAKGAPPGADVRMAMNMEMSGPARDENKSSVSYQPRDVGNDLGLWVMGTGWTDLVQEVLPGLEDKTAYRGYASAYGSEDVWDTTLGLGRLLLGDSEPALEAFSEALSRDPRDADAYLGQAAAYVVEGREAQALESYKKALGVSPNNRVARGNLKWLQTPSKVR